MRLSRKDLIEEVELYNEFFKGSKALEDFKAVDDEYNHLTNDLYSNTRAAVACYMAAAKAAEPYLKYYSYFWKCQIEFWCSTKEVTKLMRELRVNYYYN